MSLGRTILTGAGLVLAGYAAARIAQPAHTCAMCGETWRASSVAHCHRCGCVACAQCMKRAVDVHELPQCVIESATCSRCVKFSQWAMERYREALVDLEAIAIFPEDFDELAPPSYGINRDGLPNVLKISTAWYTERAAALRELKLVARFNLLEMVRHFGVDRRETVIEGQRVTLWSAHGTAYATDTYATLKPGINF